LKKNAKYIASEDITMLCRIAITLNKPILLEGVPGIGKTSLGYALANLFEINLIRIQCFEGITVEQVIGEFNYTKQLLHLQAKNDSLQDIFTEEYFIKRPLLQALTSVKPVVLLIDEIDRADEEFEAFLLEALGELQISIPELGTIKSTTNPIILMTSNGTRTLSAALRRRSIYLGLDYPEKNTELSIVLTHVPDLEDRIFEKIYSIVKRLRDSSKIAQPPSIAETLDFAKAFSAIGEDLLGKDKNNYLGILLKTKSDMIEGRKLVAD
jgi:MoxR-like ATPase